MICHGETETRQAVLHALLRADASLLDVCGTIPTDYLEGQLVLPIGLPQSRLFACLVASHPCKCAEYDPALYEQEMGAKPCPYTCMSRAPATTNTLGKKQDSSRARYA